MKIVTLSVEEFSEMLELHDRGRLWFFPDGSMYVYYTPTHWRDQPK